jgi:hypothetical protein
LTDPVLADLPQGPVQPEPNVVNRSRHPHPGAATLKRLSQPIGPLQGTVRLLSSPAALAIWRMQPPPASPANGKEALSFFRVATDRVTLGWVGGGGIRTVLLVRASSTSPATTPLRVRVEEAH